MEIDSQNNSKKNMQLIPISVVIGLLIFFITDTLKGGFEGSEGFFLGSISSLIVLILIYLFSQVQNKNSTEIENKELMLTSKLVQKELSIIKVENQYLLNQAKIERQKILEEAKHTNLIILKEAKELAKIEAERIITNTKHEIENQKIENIKLTKKLLGQLSSELGEGVKNKSIFEKYQQLLIKNLLTN